MKNRRSRGRGPVVGVGVAANPGTRAVASIGSVETGQKAAPRAAGRALLLDMGGDGPMEILDDAETRRGQRRRSASSPKSRPPSAEAPAGG